MLELNEVRLVGVLAEEPRGGTAETGAAWAIVRLQVSHTYVGRERRPVVRRDWMSVKLFGRPATYATELLGAGSHVLIKGHLRTERMQDKDSKDTRYGLVIIGDEIHGTDVDELYEPEEDPDTHHRNARAATNRQVPAPSVPAGAEGTAAPIAAGEEASTQAGEHAPSELDAGSTAFEQFHGIQEVPWPRERTSTT